MKRKFTVVTRRDAYKTYAFDMEVKDKDYCPTVDEIEDAFWRAYGQDAYDLIFSEAENEEVINAKPY